MENLRECPICLETPQEEIYQCSEGHIICDVCIEKVTECPQCRTNYGARRIRCRVLEAILDDQMFECKFSEGGCRHLCRRSDISVHANSCHFNRSRRRGYVPVCSVLAWDDGIDCQFEVASDGGSKSRRYDIINHYKSEHGRGLVYGSVSIQGHLIRTAIEKSLAGQPTTITRLHCLYGGGPLFLVILKINSTNENVSLNCIQLWGADASKKYKIDCSVIKGVKSKKDAEKCGIDKFDPILISWTLNVFTPREMEYTMKSCPIGIHKSVLMDIEFGGNKDYLHAAISLIT